MHAYVFFAGADGLLNRRGNLESPFAFSSYVCDLRFLECPEPDLLRLCEAEMRIFEHASTNIHIASCSLGDQTPYTQYAYTWIRREWSTCVESFVKMIPQNLHQLSKLLVTQCNMAVEEVRSL